MDSTEPQSDPAMQCAVIDIAMPAYNCAPWIDQTIYSILAQDFTGWRLIARDDQSRDDTHRHLLDWQSRLGDRMILLPDSGTCNLGLKGNYNAVLKAGGAPWIMTADPDDTWLPAKMARTCRVMLQAEKELGASAPIAVCTDAIVVDADGRQLAPSYWQWCRTGPNRDSDLPRVAVESPALGSTMLVNRALLNLALPVPDRAPYQDWWLALVAAAFGRLIAIPDRTILYRRHSHNATGDPYSTKTAAALRRALAAPGSARARMRDIVGGSSAIAGAFLERYRANMMPQDATAFESLANLFTLPPLERRRAILRHGLWFRSRLKNVAMLTLL